MFFCGKIILAKRLKAKLKSLTPQNGEVFAGFYARIKTEAAKLQALYQPQLREGIVLSIELINPVQEDEKDGDVDVRVWIRPNDVDEKFKVDKLNRINHIFNKRQHALDSFVQKFGSEEEAYNAVQNAANKALKEGKLTPNAKGILPSGDMGNIIEVDGVSIRLIGGRVQGDKVIISSFSRKDL